jgi:predicted ATPase/DNA-binding winged helix-turn-helix (wHTH) protein
VSAVHDPGPGDRLFFGPFELRPAERLLLRQGVPIALGGRAMDILLRLIEREGELVSPDELLASVWRGVNVDPTALRVQMSALRKSLSEADPDGRYLSNVPGRGYCFVASILREAGPVPVAASHHAYDRLAAPPALGRMIGRDAVVDDLERLIAIERFVTLVGPGGIGKTTVALALAHRMAPEFAGEVTFVDLGIQRNDTGVASAVATALHLTGVGSDPTAAVVAELRSRRLLLILDSSEHVIQGAATLAASVWESAPQVHILATSREPMNVPGEHVHRLAALEAPPPSTQLSYEEVCAYPAAQLFVERVAASGGQIERGPAEALLVSDICRKLDGIPLAIELAAGRVDAFGLATTLDLLDSRLRLSWPGRRTALPRHVTLSATLDWSYDLLSSDEAMLLRALSTFGGSFTLEAAETVADESLSADAKTALSGLVSKSLVSIDQHRSPVQYRLLDATRDYARLKLEAAGEFPAAAARHATWTMDVLRYQKAKLDAGPMVEWLDYFGKRIEDAQSALDWSLSADGDPSFTAPLTLSAIPIWICLGRAGECRHRIEAALRVVELNSRDEMMLNIALLHALLDITPHDAIRAEIASNRVLDLAERFDDVHAQLRAKWCLWNAHIATPNVPKACEGALLYRQLASDLGDSEKTVAERMVSVSELLRGNLASARASGERAQALSPIWSASARVAWYDYDPLVMSRNTLVSILWLSGAPDTAMAAAQENLEHAEATGSHFCRAAVLADACAPLALCVGDLAAADRYVAMLDDCVARGAPMNYRTWGQALRAAVAARRGDIGPGRSFLTGGAPPDCGHPRYATVLIELASALGEAGAEDIARDLSDRLLQRFEASGERWIWSEAQRVRGELSHDAAEAESLFESALTVAQQQRARAWALRAATSLARRRRSAAVDVLMPLLASFSEGFGTRDHVEARAVLGGWGLAPP